MKLKFRLRFAALATALVIVVALGVRRTFAQIDCADGCVGEFAACINQSNPACEDALDRCLEACLREGIIL
jgi:hypothetical protein